MAFFKFRARGPKGDEQSAGPAETIDDMRRRARHRLIGATVLVLVGVLGFPLLFDSQPRPIQVDIPIEIPDREIASAPGAGTGGRVAQASPEPEPADAGGRPAKVPADASLDAKEEVLSPSPAAPARAEPKAEANKQATAESRSEPKPQDVPPAVDSGARARALLEGRTTSQAAAPAAGAAEQGARFVVQVGAFADADKARETRQRLERAGLKTYTQEVQTKDGPRIRVRVGPYGVRAEADKVAERIKTLSLPAAVLTL